MADIRKAFLEKKREHQESLHRQLSPSRNGRRRVLPDRSVKRTPIFVASLWMIFFGTVAYALFFSPFHRVDTIEIQGARDISSERIRQFVEQELSGKYGGIFPKDDFFLIRSNRIGAHLSEAFPKIANVTVETRFPRSVRVVLSEQDHLFLWCSGGPCFLLSPDGMPHDARFAEQEENRPFVRFLIDESARSVEWGKPVFPAEDMAAFFFIDQAFRGDLSLDPSPISMTPSRISREARFETGEGWSVLVSFAVPPEQTIATLRLLLAKELPVEKRMNLRYVDLRTENRVFYAWKNEPAPVVAASEPVVSPEKETKKKK